MTITNEFFYRKSVRSTEVEIDGRPWNIIFPEPFNLTPFSSGPTEEAYQDALRKFEKINRSYETFEELANSFATELSQIPGLSKEHGYEYWRDLFYDINMWPKPEEGENDGEGKDIGNDGEQSVS